MKHSKKKNQVRKLRFKNQMWTCNLMSSDSSRSRICRLSSVVNAQESSQCISARMKAQDSKNLSMKIFLGLQWLIHHSMKPQGKMRKN